MSGVIENMEANIEDLRNEVAELKRKVGALESGNIEKEVCTTLEERLWTPQKERDEIVERAKSDVESLKDSKGGITSRLGYREGESGIICDAEFIVNDGKRTVVCLLKGQLSSIVYARGIAKCAPNDCFNVHIGKAIALRRALGLEVPSEYLNAPQPTEVRVGDIVEYEGEFCEVVPDNTDIGDEVPLRYCWVTSAFATQGKIIDDSRE
ncbi:hypothetical protein SAMN05216389_11152 [Oceanobacillus limi]|uniref:Uncharacterized protein n=1 Tax=Oceanobacillus limi TaxID=930131 RepID=A0A1I0EDY2_9BACI|nr:hypothetical protein [Oceanobacillus limi]SET43175.1 hypothetical protein SAMN05216389_11152 [Oceanobacillus limi]